MIEMTPGDFVNIPAHKKQRVEWAAPDEAKASSTNGDRQLTDEQVIHIKNFIKEVGGAENARAAIEALEKLRTAA